MISFPPHIAGLGVLQVVDEETANSKSVSCTCVSSGEGIRGWSSTEQWVELELLTLHTAYLYLYDLSSCYTLKTTPIEKVSVNLNGHVVLTDGVNKHTEGWNITYYSLNHINTSQAFHKYMMKPT